MQTLKTIWAYVKKWWGLAALVIGAVVAFFVFRGQSTNFAERLKALQDVHDEELKKISDIRAQEQKEHIQNEKRLQETLDAVQRHYDEAKKQLDEKKKAEVEDIVTKFGDDPDAMARKLAEATGMTIVLPER